MLLANSDFLRLIDAVEAQDGAHLDDTCHADEINYEFPNGTRKSVLTNGCEKETVFEIPYDPTETVLVPEPLLEPDPDRSEWVDENGDSRQTRRSKTEEIFNDHGESTGSTRTLFEIVEREGERPDSGIIDRSTVRVCALDDNIGMWPRFKGTLQDPRSK